MWIIASIPLWIIGGAALLVAVWGGVLCLRTDKTAKDVGETALGSGALLVLASIFFSIAAKIAS